MSEVDSYRHTCLGMVTCPSRFPFVFGNDASRSVAIYRLDEDTRGDDSFRGKRGDILVGGGRGEADALRISMPEALSFFTHEDLAECPDSATWRWQQLVRAYWSMTNAYIFGDGYARLGWTPNQPLELWLMHHVLGFLIHHYADDYAAHGGPEPLAVDGAICRLLTPGEMSY